jgi:hypothetical protein
VDISSTVTSFFNNYTFFRFERSIDNGATWTVPGSGTGTPSSTSDGYQYTAQLTPSFLADSAHHLNQYRFVVASSAANLSNAACSFIASTKIIVLVNNCLYVLNIKDSSTRIRRTVSRTDDATEIKKLINPFSDKISFDISSTKESPAVITIVDNYGKLVKQVRSKVSKGTNSFVVDQWSRYSSGTYFLRIDLMDQSFNRILIKTN